MTLIELQNALSTQIEAVTNSEELSKDIIATAELTSKLAKQMINNADVILRADKLSDSHSRIDKITGDIS